ncbi:MAG: glutamate synthase subunit beta [Victivallales bacterium]|nr:glutamate synthase subunit beta [Victivallales bacterium]
MSTLRGFIEIMHKKNKFRDIKRRVKDFQEVELRLSDQDIMQQAARCMDCGIPFCHGCGCPLSNYIPEWNELVSEGYWQEALKILLSTNEFPEFTGRICPALCEGSCTVGLNSEAVTVRQIELALIEKGFENGWIKPFIPNVRTGKKIAVIGSGPAGLAAAARLNKYGHEVTVFEKNEKPGGLMRYGIPDFKMDKTVIDRRIQLLKDSGVNFECNLDVGNDISGNYLLKKFDAVVLSCGAQVPRNLDVPGRQLQGIYYAMDFLKQQNQIIGEETFPEERINAENKKVVVIGGGDTGSDCVGTAIRQNAASVTQLEIMPMPPRERSESTPWPLWPYKLRTSSSHEEGCNRIWNTMTTGFEGSGKNVSKVNTVKVEWNMSKEGRPLSPEVIPGTKSSIETDLVLIAMGFTGVKYSKLINQLGCEIDSNSNLKTENSGKVLCKSDNVFSAGDAVSGASLVVSAMNSGTLLAEKIDNFLK